MSNWRSGEKIDIIFNDNYLSLTILVSFSRNTPLHLSIRTQTNMPDINTSNIPNRSHQEVLTELLDIQNKDILDVGCGNGHLTRLMTELGANVIGIDAETQQLQRAQLKTIRSELYLQGAAEQLPIGDNTTQIIVFFNSLHHVPVNYLGAALNEAHRALKDGGILYISEPLAKGPLFELSRTFNDETIVREEAYKALKRALKNGFVEEKELFYKTEVCYSGFQAYRENSISINPERDIYFQSAGDNFRILFEKLGQREKNGWRFPQAIRVNKLKVS